MSKEEETRACVLDVMRRDLSQPFGMHDEPLPPLGPVGLTLHVVLYAGAVVVPLAYFTWHLW